MNSTSGDILRHPAAKSRRNFWLHTSSSLNAIEVTKSFIFRSSMKGWWGSNPRGGFVRLSPPSSSFSRNPYTNQIIRSQNGKVGDHGLRRILLFGGTRFPTQQWWGAWRCAKHRILKCRVLWALVARFSQNAHILPCFAFLADHTVFGNRCATTRCAITICAPRLLQARCGVRKRIRITGNLDEEVASFGCNFVCHICRPRWNRYIHIDKSWRCL